MNLVRDQMAQFHHVDVADDHFLVERFTGQTMPATGVSIGVDRLAAVLEALKTGEVEQAAGPVVVTLLALSIPGIFSGAIITETIFRINGLGSLLLTSIRQSDIPMVQSLVFIFAALTVLFNIIADILYGFLDPRIRYD